MSRASEEFLKSLQPSACGHDIRLLPVDRQRLGCRHCWVWLCSISWCAYARCVYQHDARIILSALTESVNGKTGDEKVDPMSLYEILTIVTCVTSTATMLMVGVAILPHVKNGCAVVRDAVLWVSLIAVLMLMGWLGIQQFTNRSATVEENEPENYSTNVETTTLPIRSDR